jgi:DNA topoisomerase-1
LQELKHNGIIVTQYEPKGFSVLLQGKKIKLTPQQEEMAVAWVKKLGTIYVQDEVFVKNFFEDFLAALGVNEKLKPTEFDFSEIQQFVEKEKLARLNMSKEEKKKLAADRKTIREQNKEKFGYATVDRNNVDLANYIAEPSCIFMGRGKHPLRGKWKQGPKQENIVLNLSPGAVNPEGNWKGRVWQPDDMWIAKWDDKLSGKVKYVWLADSASVKQEREIEKFNLAIKLEEKIDVLRDHIYNSLNSESLMRRKVATVCYLIDILKLRVGDEKDKDEADTVGATTLRPEHIKINENGYVQFNFLGKDSVEWNKEVQLREDAVRNLKEFISLAQSPVFDGVRSGHVKRFLGEVLPGLTAKVFRTYHASRVVREHLEKSGVTRDDAMIQKKEAATLANLQAAIECNHKKQLPKNWDERITKQKQRLEAAKAKSTEKAKERAKELRIKLELMKKTGNYNLGTSLKSYIDPRLYYNWGKKVDYDWKLYYSATLQRKFSWVEKN